MQLLLDFVLGQNINILSSCPKHINWNNLAKPQEE